MDEKEDNLINVIESLTMKLKEPAVYNRKAVLQTLWTLVKDAEVKCDY